MKKIILTVRMILATAKILNYQTAGDVKTMRKLRHLFDLFAVALKPYHKQRDQIYADAVKLEDERNIVLRGLEIEGTALDEEGKLKESFFTNPQFADADKQAKLHEAKEMSERLNKYAQEMEEIRGADIPIQLTGETLTFAFLMFSSSIEKLSKQGSQDVTGQGNITMLDDIAQIFECAIDGKEVPKKEEESEPISE